MSSSLSKFFEVTDNLIKSPQDWLESLVSDYEDKYIQERIDKLEYLTLRLKTALLYSSKNKNAKKEGESVTYTISDVAEMLQISKQSVKSYIEEGMLKAIPIKKEGKRGIIRILKSDFQLFLNRRDEFPKYK
ncbi:MAG: helix-turn-helix domain-containing protein [Bacteroidales bacterium]|nr:helix-turn-helix domain-containing protein [Bacteroidales bacterium]